LRAVGEVESICDGGESGIACPMAEIQRFVRYCAIYSMPRREWYAICGAMALESQVIHLRQYFIERLGAEVLKIQCLGRKIKLMDQGQAGQAQIYPSGFR
jgi:hypothetical protein